MADIDQIIAGGAGASSRADFSGIADLPEQYWKGKDRRFTQEGRDLFKSGVPMVRNPDGTTSIDYGAMRNALIGHGDIGQGIAVDNLDLARQQLKFGQQQSAGIQNVEGGGSPATPLLPQSTNRTVPAPGAGRLQMQEATPESGGAPSGATPTRSASIMQILAAQGIPNDQLGAASATVARQLGVDDPTQPIDVTDPRVRNVLVPAVQQLKRAGVGQIIPPGQPTPPPQVLAPPQAGAPVAQPVAQAPQQAPAPAAGQPGPVTNALTGTTGQQTPSRVDQLISYYAGILSNPMSPKQNVELAKTRLESLQKSQELTPEQKIYAQDVAQGFRGTRQEHAAKLEADKTYAAEDTKSYIKKYDAITKAGAESATELPKLALAKQIMANPDFYTGPVEGLNLAYKRILATIDPQQANAAQPQEAFRKIISDSVRSQIRSLAESGVGRISIPEVRIIEKAAANQENTPASNRLLVELSTRMHQQTLGLDELARNYNGGRLNPGFDTAARNWVKEHPLVTANELKDPRIIAPPVFANGDAVRKAGLPEGSPFQTPDGKIKWVPYIRVTP